MRKPRNAKEAGKRAVEQTRQVLADGVRDRVQSHGWLISEMAVRSGLSKIQFMRVLRYGTNSARAAAVIAYGSGRELQLEVEPR